MKKSAIEHGLDGKVPAEGEIGAPHRTQFVHSDLVVQFDEIVGVISIPCTELASACGEIPTVLTVVVYFCEVTDEMLMPGHLYIVFLHLVEQ